MSSVMTASFNGKPLFTPKLIATADSGISLNKGTGKLILCGNLELDEVRKYANDPEVKTVEAVPGTVLPSNCNSMFSEFKAISIDLSNVDSSKVTTMGGMFYNCPNLETIDLSNFDTKNVTYMGGDVSEFP